MSKDNDTPLPGTYMAIEVYGPDGLHWIKCHEISHLREEAERASKFGYELTAAKAGGIGAFTPKVEPDEIGDTPFDKDNRSLVERLQLIPGTRIHDLRETAQGLTGRIQDYGSGRTMDLRIEHVQPELRPVRSE